MTSSIKALCWLAAGLVLSAGAQAVTADADSSSGSPYQAIVDRNVFGLRPPPPPPSPEANKPPPPNIILNGITTILGKKQALMKINLPPKPPEPAKEQAFILTVGQRDGEIEVLAIDEQAGMVTVNDYGTITNLTLKDNGPKTAGGGAPAGAVPAHGMIPPPGGQVPAPFGGNPAFRSIPTMRPMRPLGMGTGGAMSPAATTTAATTASPGIYTGGGATLSGFGSTPTTTAQPQQPAMPQLSTEEVAAMMEVNREATKEDVLAGRVAPIPITPYTPRGAVGTMPEDNAPAQIAPDPNSAPLDATPQPSPTTSRHMQRR